MSEEWNNLSPSISPLERLTATATPMELFDGEITASIR